MGRFSAVGDGANEALLRINIAQLLRQRGEAGRSVSGEVFFSFFPEI